MLKQTTLKDSVTAGDLKVKGGKGKLAALSYMDNFDFWSNIATPSCSY